MKFYSIGYGDYSDHVEHFFYSDKDYDEQHFVDAVVEAIFQVVPENDIDLINLKRSMGDSYRISRYCEYIFYHNISEISDYLGDKYSIYIIDNAIGFDNDGRMVEKNIRRHMELANELV